MSSTFSPIKAFDYAKRYIKNMPLEQVQVQILDDVNKYMWMAAPWRWTIGTLGPVSLINSTQDYASVTCPSDFLYVQDAYITDAAGGVPRYLHVEPYLPSGGKLGTPSHCTFINYTLGATGTLRLHPQPGNVVTNWEVIARYKKIAPVLSASNINTSGILVFDDEWFHVYVSGVLYYAYLFGDDQRAGSAQIDPASGKVQFSGQRGVWEANIAIMKQHEKLPSVSGAQPEQKDNN